MTTNKHFWSYLAQFLQEWKMFQTKVMEKIKTRISCSVTFFFFFFENRAVYERTWRNHAQPGRPQMTTLRIHITCWITEAANTLSEYVIIIAISLQKWLHKSASMLRHTYVASPIILCIVNYILCTKPCTTYNFFDINVGRSENGFTSYIWVI